MTTTDRRELGSPCGTVRVLLSAPESREASRNVENTIKKSSYEEKEGQKGLP